MHSSGRNIGGRLGPVFVLLAAFAGAALAAEDCVEQVPAGESYSVAAVLMPGPNGGEVADVKGQGHVNFRVAFGADLRVSVNGADAGAFEPGGTYGVNVFCWEAGGQWFATTHVVNQLTGELIYEQVGFPMPDAGDRVHAAADHVVQLHVDG
jgi:hypothetical protein